MSVFNVLAHNGSLMLRAESIINGFLDSETEEHRVGCYLVNPDGTRIAIQKGFKLENYEYVIHSQKLHTSHFKTFFLFGGKCIA